MHDIRHVSYQEVHNPEVPEELAQLAVLYKVGERKFGFPLLASRILMRQHGFIKLVKKEARKSYDAWLKEEDGETK